MSFFGKLFGKKPAATPAASSTVFRSTSSNPAKDPNLIRVHDAYGRELFITKQAWRDTVLTDHIKSVWNDADALAGVIIQSLNDGFARDVLRPAHHLVDIDPYQQRSAILLANVYLKLHQFNDAEKVLREFIARHGETGAILTNLAKVQSAYGQSEQTLRTLWHALELDPNQDNGVAWYHAMVSEKDGPDAGLAALHRIAALPAAWRARLWLARDALKRSDLAAALAFYQEAFGLAPRPVPGDMLQQMSGDLGNQGHLPEILQIVAPHFDIAIHGIAVGNNLIKANLDLGRIDAARELLDQHYGQKRPDWKETLAFWDNELAKTRVSISQPDPGFKPSITTLQIDGPIWLREASAANELFLSTTGEVLRIGFLGSTASGPTIGTKETHQLSDAVGRMSRAIPLFLAEQVRFGSQAAVRTLVPWVTGKTPAFVLGGVAWDAGTAAQQARQGDKPCDYVVVTHLNAATDLWHVELQLIRTIDAKCLAVDEVKFPAARAHDGLPDLAPQLLQLLVAHADMTRAVRPSAYAVPSGAEFPHYLLRLEQLLAVRCYANAAENSEGFHGEREVLDGNLQLCLNHPLNVTTRVLFLQTLSSMKHIRPNVVEEYRDKALLLQKEKPLPNPAHAIAERMTREIFPA